MEGARPGAVDLKSYLEGLGMRAHAHTRERGLGAGRGSFFFPSISYLSPVVINALN